MLFPQTRLGWGRGGLRLAVTASSAKLTPTLPTVTTTVPTLGSTGAGAVSGSGLITRRKQQYSMPNWTRLQYLTPQPQRRLFQSSCYSSHSLSHNQLFPVHHSNFHIPLISSVSTDRRFCRILPIMATLTQTRSHSGHKHGHGHHHDNVYLTSQNKNDAGVRITRIGLFSNLGMAIAKGIGGYLFNSKAMVADAIHSLTDLASDILTLATISWSLKPPSDKFPTGFGKIESLGSLGVSSMLLFGGLWMGYGSLLTLYGHFLLDPTSAADLMAHAHSHGHDHGADGVPSIHAAWLAAGTVAIKEWLYHASKFLPFFLWQRTRYH